MNIFRKSRLEGNFRRTLEPEEITYFYSALRELAQEAERIYRASHGGGCPYPVK